jgi:hypothetical protein
MSFIEFTNADAAKSAFVNALTAIGVEPNASMDANALVFAALANQVSGPPTTQNGAGFAGTGTINKQVIANEGDLIITRLLVDLTGLGSSTTDLDIIGAGESPAFMTRITSANGTIIGGTMQCLEVPAGGVVDIDLYAATEGTGVFDGGIASLTETAVVTSGGNWTLGRVLGTAPDGIANNAYLYLTCGAAGTPGTYTAGRILITLFGI